jgi:hypothetical protein
MTIEKRTRPKDAMRKYDNRLRHCLPTLKDCDRAVAHDPYMWSEVLMTSDPKGSYSGRRKVQAAIERIEARDAGVSCDADFERTEWCHGWISGYDVTW